MDYDKIAARFAALKPEYKEQEIDPDKVPVEIDIEELRARFAALKPEYKEQEIDPDKVPVKIDIEESGAKFDALNCVNSTDPIYLTSFKHDDSNKIWKNSQNKCYHIESVCNIIKNNNGINVDQTKEKPLWNKDDLDSLLKIAREVQPECYTKILETAEQEITLSAQEIEIIKQVGELGWIALADHISQFKMDFPIFQRILPEMIEKFNLTENKASWERVQDLNYQGKTLREKLNVDMKDECIHKFGLWLISFYLSYHQQHFSAEPLFPMLHYHSKDKFFVEVPEFDSGEQQIAIHLIIIHQRGLNYTMQHDQNYLLSSDYGVQLRIQTVYNYLKNKYALNFFAMDSVIPVPGSDKPKHPVLIIQGEDNPEARAFDDNADTGLMALGRSLERSFMAFMHVRSIEDIVFALDSMGFIEQPDGTLEPRKLAHLIILSHGDRTTMHLSNELKLTYNSDKQVDIDNFSRFVELLNSHLRHGARVFLHGCSMGEGAPSHDNFAGKLASNLTRCNTVFAASQVVDRFDLQTDRFMQNIQKGIIYPNYNVRQDKETDNYKIWRFKNPDCGHPDDPNEIVERQVTAKNLFMRTFRLNRDMAKDIIARYKQYGLLDTQAAEQIWDGLSNITAFDREWADIANGSDTETTPKEYLAATFAALPADFNFKIKLSGAQLFIFTLDSLVKLDYPMILRFIPETDRNIATYQYYWLKLANVHNNRWQSAEYQLSLNPKMEEFRDIIHTLPMQHIIGKLAFYDTFFKYPKVGQTIKAEYRNYGFTEQQIVDQLWINISNNSDYSSDRWYGVAAGSGQTLQDFLVKAIDNVKFQVFLMGDLLFIYTLKAIVDDGTDTEILEMIPEKNRSIDGYKQLWLNLAAKFKDLWQVGRWVPLVPNIKLRNSIELIEMLKIHLTSVSIEQIQQAQAFDMSKIVIMKDQQFIAELNDKEQTLKIFKNKDHIPGDGLYSTVVLVKDIVGNKIELITPRFAFMPKSQPVETDTNDMVIEIREMMAVQENCRINFLGVDLGVYDKTDQLFSTSMDGDHVQLHIIFETTTEKLQQIIDISTDEVPTELLMGEKIFSAVAQIKKNEEPLKGAIDRIKDSGVKVTDNFMRVLFSLLPFRLQTEWDDIAMSLPYDLLLRKKIILADPTVNELIERHFADIGTDKNIVDYIARVKKRQARRAQRK